MDKDRHARRFEPRGNHPPICGDFNDTSTVESHLDHTASMSGRPSASSTTHTQPVAPTVPAAIHALADPPPTLIDSHLPSYLLPEVLRCLQESSSHVIRRKRKLEDEYRAEGLIPRDNGKRKGPEDDKRLIDAEIAGKIERMGLMVGGYVAER